jgi:uncharacterized protein (DUF433 family)
MRRIIRNPKLLGGKPVVEGTRLSVELILRNLADGWAVEDLFEAYPNLDEEGLQAVFSYAYGLTQQRRAAAER